MLDEEFLKQHPISVYHGIYNEDGRVGALLSNPNVSSKIYAVDEWCLHNCVLKGRDHQRICPQDNRNLAATKVYEGALHEVQAEKLSLGILLERPLLDTRPELTLIHGGLSAEL